MARFIILLLLMPGISSADRVFDGIYVTGGIALSEARVDFLGDERNIRDERPMVFLGYGKTSRMINDRGLRMFIGLEGFYMADSKTERGVDTISREQVITETEVIESVTEGEITTETTTITREIETAPVETRRYEVKHGDTWGAGIRVGISEQNDNRTGAIYGLLGYAETSIEAQGEITDSANAVILSVPDQEVDFSGLYYGLGYEYVFTPRWALRLDYLKLQYGSETLETVEGASNNSSLLNSARHSDLDQEVFFIGITGRF